MENYNWKNELKRIAINLADECYFILCSISVAAIIFHFQPEKSMQVFKWICDYKDWSISVIFLTGIAIWAFLLRCIITGIFKCVLFLCKPFIRNEESK